MAPQAAQALQEALRAVVGGEHVWVHDEGVAQFSRCTIPHQSRCRAVVFPETAQQVAEVLRIAGAAGIEVWPYSGGRNWGYGATLAVSSGAIVMVLRRMKRIEVDETLAYALVEPGVTYRELSEHLRQMGDRLWPDCIDGTPDGSVIGNALDRGIGETPYGDHFGNLCGLEVVLSGGEIIQTGNLQGGDVRTRHLHKWGVGPYVEGMFSQSNLGVVTRAGIWLMPRPECFNSFVFELHDESNFDLVVDAFRRLALQGVLTSKLHMINDVVSFTIVTQRIRESVHQDAPLSDTDRDRLQRKYRIAPWSCAGGLYGSRRSVAVQRRALKQAIGHLGRLVVVSDAKVGLLERLLVSAWKSRAMRLLAELAFRASLPVMDSFPQVHRILKGIPTDYFLKHAYYRHAKQRPDTDVEPARDRCGLIWFAPILPNVGAEIREYLGRCRAMMKDFGFDFYVALLMMNPRAVVCLMNINFDRENDAEAERAIALYGALMQTMREMGYEQYRSSLPGWSQSASEPADGTAQLLARIKRALDPQGIIAPGRYGVDGQ